MTMGRPACHGCPFSSIMSHQTASELRWPRLDENRPLWFSQAWWAKFALAMPGVRGGSTAKLRQTHRWPRLTENGPDSSREDNGTAATAAPVSQHIPRMQDNAIPGAGPRDRLWRRGFRVVDMSSTVVWPSIGGVRMASHFLGTETGQGDGAAALCRTCSEPVWPVPTWDTDTTSGLFKFNHGALPRRLESAQLPWADPLSRSRRRDHWAGGEERATARPLRKTARIRWIASGSVSGSPSTASRSASNPAATRPLRSAKPQTWAATDVTVRSA